MSKKYFLTFFLLITIQCHVFCINITKSPGSSAISAIGATFNITSATVNQRIIHDGSDWINQYPNFLTAQDGAPGSSALFIDNAGNVGIGTTTPISILHIEQVTKNNGITFTTDDTGQTSTDGSNIFVEQTSKDLIINNRENAEVAFFVNGSERMTIEASGEVGIGTTNPGSLLHLYSETSTGLDLQIASNGTTNNRRARHALDYINEKYSIYSRNDDGSLKKELISFDLVTGNVGIGQTNPDYPLDVAGTANVEGDFFAGSDAFSVDSVDGSVGIGITTSGRNLHVYDSLACAVEIQSSSNTAQLIINSGTPNTQARIVFQENNATKWSMGNDGADSHKFKIGFGLASIAAATDFVIDSAGLVGVSNDTPLSTIDISGSFATEIVTKTGDYTATVFDNTIIVDTDTAGADVTITLPTTSTCSNRHYNIVNAGNTGYDVIVTGNISADKFTGGGVFQVPSMTILDTNAISVQTEGTAWYVY